MGPTYNTGQPRTWLSSDGSENLHSVEGRTIVIFRKGGKDIMDVAVRQE